MDKLRGIDVSEWQNKMDFSPYDFVFVRASYGDGISDKRKDIHARKALKQGKLLGFYHYAYPNFNADYHKEVETFLDATKDYRGKCLYALDWEDNAVSYSTDWAYGFLNEVYKETGIMPLFYTFAAEAVLSKYRMIAAKFPLWQAQTGVKKPDKTAWGKMPTIWQYAHKPYDFDIFYGTREDWERWAKGGEDEMTQDDFNRMMKVWLSEQEKKPADSWAEKSLEQIKFKGLMIGDTAGNLMPQSFVKREELAVILDKMT